MYKNYLQFYSCLCTYRFPDHLYISHSLYSRIHAKYLYIFILYVCVFTHTTGIEHDIKIWAPTAARPQPPSPLAVQQIMARNKQDRDSSSDLLTQPEQWLLQLLATQRRRWVVPALRYTVHQDNEAAVQRGSSEGQHLHSREHEGGSFCWLLMELFAL